MALAGGGPRWDDHFSKTCPAKFASWRHRVGSDRRATEILAVGGEGKYQVRKSRKTSFALVAVLSSVMAFAVTAGSAIAASDGSGPSAVAAKKKCKKGSVRKHGKCKRKGGAGGPGAAYSDGRYSGTFSEGGQIYFTVGGGRMYTEGRDAFALNASCSGGSPSDYTPIYPVQAPINNGAFAQSGSFTPGFGQVIPWSISGQIAGSTVSNGVFTVGPYQDFYGNTCSATGHFTATRCSVPSSCVFVPVYPPVYY